MSKRSQPPNISVEDLVRVATQILTEHGLADLSMRRVATALGIAPSALYWHIKDKQTLLAAVVDNLLAGVEVPELSGDARSDIATRAHVFYKAAMGIRDGAELLTSVIALGTGGHRLRTTLAQTGAEPVTVDAVATALMGHAMIAQQRAQAAEIGVNTGAELTDFVAIIQRIIGEPR